MRIGNINSRIQPIAGQNSKNENATQISQNFQQTKPVYNISFHSLWGKKSRPAEKSTQETELNANDMILSLKLADTLHQMDEKSLIAIGDSNSAMFKTVIQGQLTKEDSFLPNPKKIEKIYVINDSGIDPLLIGKGVDDKFLIYGKAQNLKKEKNDYYPYKHEPAEWGNIIEKENKTRIKLIKTPKESNNILYDEKYPVESFLTKGIEVDGGLIINETAEIRQQKIKKSTGTTNRPEIPFRTFSDVAGLSKTIEVVKRKILYPMLYPEAFPDSKNRGTILYGPPGTGKTLLALAVIGEVKKRQDKNIHCIQVDGSSLTHSLVGKTEAKWRKIFKEAKEHQPSLIFIDEIDNVLGKREDGENFVHNNGVVSQFLTLTENLEKNNDKIWIIGATNRPENIDPAIKRNGRFGNLIEVPVPDEKGCLEILNHYLKTKKVSPEFNREIFARELFKNSATGADIAAIVDNARENMYERCGIFEKMEKGTFKQSDLEKLEYNLQDFKLP